MKKYMLKRVFAMVLITAIALLPIFEAGSVKAAIIDTSEKTVCDATLEDEFSSNEVLITVAPEYNYNVYGKHNFSEIGCTGIKELSTTIKHGEICKFIKLDLSCNSKQDVLSAIKQLEKREDIYCDYNPDGESPKTADPVMLAVPAFTLLASTLAMAWLFRRKRSI